MPIERPIKKDLIMHYLHVYMESGGSTQTMYEPSQEDLMEVDEGILQIFRSTIHGFEMCAVHAQDETRSAVWNPVESLEQPPKRAA